MGSNFSCFASSSNPSRGFFWLSLGFCFGLLMVPGAWLQAQERYFLEDQTWQKEPSPPTGSPEAQILAIRKALAAGNFKQARNLADAWISQHPNHPLLVQAHFLRAEALVGLKDEYEALFDYELVLRQFPGSPEFHLALEREYEIARLYSNGMKRKFLGMRILSAASEAEEIFIRIQERAPGSPIGEKASLELGEHYLRQGQMDSAATAFDMFLVNYPRSAHREKAMLRLIQAHLACFRGPRFDATSLREAIQRLRIYQQEFPAAAEQLGVPGLLARIEESLARKDFLVAQWYLKRGEKVSAIYSFRRVLQDYPQTAAAQEALAQLRQLGLDLPASLPAGAASGTGNVSP